MLLRHFIKEKDAENVYKLWYKTFNNTWPLSYGKFIEFIDGYIFKERYNNYVIIENNKVVGFISTLLNIELSKGQIMVLMVDEKYRNKGIGHQLLDAVMKDFGDLKIKNIQLGAGVGSYIWPGVPADLPGAIQFFEKYGFDFKEEIIDMVMELNNYSTPQYVYDRIKNLGIQIREANRNDVSGILDFERTNFPNWYIYYKDLCDNGDVEKIHIAIYDQKIVGAVILIDKGITWEDYFGKKTGGIGCIGVAENYRNKGIGLALAARITESLKIKGFDISYVGYTWLDEWYGKLGYKIWRKYKMGYMEL